MMRISVLLFGLLASVVLLADDRTIDYDPNTDFSKVKTFALREGRIDSPKPELNNRLFGLKLTEAIRSELLAKGLKESRESPDVFIDFSITGRDLSVVERGVDVRMPTMRGMPGVVIPSGGPQAVLLTEGALVIDMKDPGGKLLWRGTHRNEENRSPKLAQKLPADAKKLLSQYPPKKKSKASAREVSVRIPLAARRP
jgi:hypothetical protein